MSLYKRPDSEIWWISVSIPNAPRLRESSGTTDRQEAQRYHDKRKAESWNQPRLTGRTWGDAVLLWCDAETRSDSELLSLAKFGRNFNDRSLASVTREAVHEALSFCKTAGTYTRYRTMIAAILNKAKDAGWINEVPKLEVRKDKKKKTRKWLTYEQWERLRAELPPHQRLMATFAVETGLRQSNVLQLTWSRVDLDRKLVWVEAEEAKGGEAIPVPLSTGAMNVLKSVQGTHEKFVFTYRGKPITEVKTAFQAACIRAGLGSVRVEHGEDSQRRNSVRSSGSMARKDHVLAASGGKGLGDRDVDEEGPRGHRAPKGVARTSARYEGFTWHGLRHTWATWHIQSGTPVEVLQKLGAWSDLRMVMNYAHHSAGHLASFANNTRKVRKS